MYISREKRIALKCSLNKNIIQENKKSQKMAKFNLGDETWVGYYYGKSSSVPGMVDVRIGREDYDYEPGHKGDFFYRKPIYNPYEDRYIKDGKFLIPETEVEVFELNENALKENVEVEVTTDEGTSKETIEIPQEDTIDNFGPTLGITDLLLQAINDENETIQFYNNLIASCNAEGFDDIANIVKHINEEENIHVGMLQHAMTTISEQAKDIDKGVEEAEQIIAGEEPVEE